MKCIIAALTLTIVFTGIAFVQEVPAKERKTPAVEVVFVLDTTGSMSGLIEGAKRKIWSIVNHIADGEPTPDVKVGLVGYRDRGDDYVTKIVDLSGDLDDIYGKLREFKADGGGDTPESVNQALNEAVTKISWSSDNKSLRVIFLVGDCPPHMDYKDDVKYKDSCSEAVKKDIIINAVQCGGYSATAPFWQEIARLSEGTYVQIEQSGGVVSVDTPYDEELAKLGRELDKTVVFAGKKELRDAEEKRLVSAGEIAGKETGAAADRAAFKGKSGPARPSARATDLVEKAAEGELNLGEMKEEELPEEMKKMSAEEREKYIEGKKAKREEVRKKIEELGKKREKYIEKELEKRSGSKDSFDKKVIESVKKHAAKKGIEYDKEEKPDKDK